MGLPLRHHIVVYLLAQAVENQGTLQSRLKFNGGEVDATAWVDETLAAVVARSDDFGQLMKVPQRYFWCCLLYTSPSPRDLSTSRMPSSA